jgi:hypothetical protein
MRDALQIDARPVLPDRASPPLRRQFRVRGHQSWNVVARDDATHAPVFQHRKLIHVGARTRVERLGDRRLCADAVQLFDRLHRRDGARRRPAFTRNATRTQR